MKNKYVLLSGYLLSFVIGAALTMQVAASFTTYTIGKVLGIWALTALTFQLLLVTRMSLIEHAVGYDRITRWHAANGMLILGLVLLHPVLILRGLRLDLSESVQFVVNTPEIWLGEVAILILIFQIVSTLYWKSLDYEHWRIIHRIGYIIVVLGFLHSFLLGTDISVPPDNLLSTWWLTLAAVCVGSVAYRYGYRPLRKQRRFRVAAVRKETNDVHTVELVPADDADDMVHDPGQFAFVRFESEDLPAEEHHFTIASAPDRDGFVYTIKAVGDFTSRIGDLETGDTAIVEGPYGAFTLDDTTESVTFVAGGIGITPFMSMLRHLNRENGKNPDVHLLYGNRTVADIAFRDELAELEARNDWLTVTHILSDEDREGYEHGFIGEEMLADTDTGGQYYVCGPPPMMDAVEDALKALGVSSGNIRTERFSLRDVNWRRLLPF